MKNITFILTDPVYKIVGGYKMVYIYANALSDAGYSVNIVYRRYKRCKTKVVDRMDRFIRKYLLVNMIHWFDLNKAIKKIVVEDLMELPKSDVYIVTALPTMIEYYEIYKYKFKTLYFIQDFENWGVSEETVYKTYESAYAKVVVSHWLEKIVDKYSGNKCVCIPNGINLNVFKMKTGLTDRKKHSLAMLYHTQERKGTTDGLEIIYMLKEKYTDLEVKLFGSPKPPKNLPDWIHYKRNASPEEVASIFNNVSVFLCPSKVEGFGLTGLESMACGCALVSTPCKGVLEYASNRNNALISSGFSKDELYRNICEIFDDENLRTRIVMNAQKEIEKFDVSCGEKKFVNLIEDIITKDIG